MIIKMKLESFNKVVKLINKADGIQELLGMPANNTALIKKFTVLGDNTVEVEMSDTLFDMYLAMAGIYMNCMTAAMVEFKKHEDEVMEIAQKAIEEFSI